jgi:hypothetical protein
MGLHRKKCGSKIELPVLLRKRMRLLQQALKRNVGMKAQD